MAEYGWLLEGRDAAGPVYVRVDDEGFVVMTHQPELAFRMARESDAIAFNRIVSGRLVMRFAPVEHAWDDPPRVTPAGLHKPAHGGRL